MENDYPSARTHKSMTMDDFEPEERETVEQLRDIYVGSIINSPDDSFVGYALWYRQHNNPMDDASAEREYIILSSPTRKSMFTSADVSFGQNEMFTLTPEFFRAIQICYHQMACMTPRTYYNDMDYTEHTSSFSADLDYVYGGIDQYPEFEAWLIAEITPFLFTADDAPPELRPLGEWIAELTKWPVPALGIEDKFDEE